MAFNKYLNIPEQQYIDTYVPMPIDFIDKQLAQRQQRYDAGVQAVAQAEDVYGGMDVLPGDAEAKSRIIKEQFGDIDELVKSDYQGDYGKAFNLISRRIAGLHGNTDIKTFQRNLESKKAADEIKARMTAAGREFVDYGQFQGQGSYDPDTGELREMDFVSGIESVEDATKFMDTTLIKRLTNDIVERTLRGSGRFGLLQYGYETGTTQRDIASKITRADVEAFKQANPNWMFKQGLQSDEDVYNTLVNYAMSAVPHQVRSAYTKDPSFGLDLTGGQSASFGGLQTGFEKKKDDTYWATRRGRNMLRRDGEDTLFGRILSKAGPYIETFTKIIEPGPFTAEDKLAIDKMYEGYDVRSKKMQEYNIAAKEIVDQFGDNAIEATQVANDDFGTRHIGVAFSNLDKNITAEDLAIRSRLNSYAIFDPDTEELFQSFDAYQKSLKEGMFKNKTDKSDALAEKAVPAGYTRSDLFPNNSVVMTADVGDGETKSFIAIKDIGQDPNNTFTVVNKMNLDMFDRGNRTRQRGDWHQAGKYQTRAKYAISDNYKYGVSGYEVRERGSDKIVKSYNHGQSADLLEFINR